MVPLDRAMIIYSSLAAILYVKFPPAAIARVHRITVSILAFSARYSSVTIAHMGLLSLWEIAFFLRPKVGCWPSDIGCMVGTP